MALNSDKSSTFTVLAGLLAVSLLAAAAVLYLRPDGGG